MGNLLVYNPDKVAGTALCNLLRLRGLVPTYYGDWEAVVAKVRFLSLGVLLIDCGSLAEIFMLLQDLIPIVKEAGVTIILLTPLSHHEKEIQNLENQGYVVMEKPVIVHELVAAINKAIHE